MLSYTVCLKTGPAQKPLSGQGPSDSK